MNAGRPTRITSRAELAARALLALALIAAVGWAVLGGPGDIPGPRLAG